MQYVVATQKHAGARISSIYRQQIKDGINAFHFIESGGPWAE